MLPIEKTTFIGFCFFTHVILLNLTIKDRPVRIQQVDRHGRSKYVPRAKRGQGPILPRLPGFQRPNVSRIPKTQGFRVSKGRGFPLLTKAFNELAFPKSKGFRENIQNMNSIKISSSVNSVPLCDLSSLWGKVDQWGSALHVKVFESGNQLFENPLILHF